MADHHKRVRVRFAPSPTGLLHIGGLRTALYNYLYARRHGGTFVLRIEDTDRTRYVEEAELDILESLAWAGLNPDEGPVMHTERNISSEGNSPADSALSGYEKSLNNYRGSFGPYHQSARKQQYRKYAEQLVSRGYAYYAFDTVEEIESMRESLKTSENPAPKYDGQTRMQMRNSLTLDEDEVNKLLSDGAETIIRLKIPKGESVHFEDLVRGAVSFETDGLDDQVLIKADGMPTYHLANVVDDHEMDITHVIRGEEWLSSTPKHILLYKYLGWDVPKMAHLPLIMSPGGGKLSKRKAEEEGIPVNVRDYRSGYYERDGLVNFLGLLGWSPGDDRETLTLHEMQKEFSLERVGKSGAIFDYDKLIWFNEHYLRKRTDEDIAAQLIRLIKESGFPKETFEKSTDSVSKVQTESDESGWKSLNDEQRSLVSDMRYMTGIVRLLKERVSLIPEFISSGRFFFEAPKEYDKKAVKKAWKQGTSQLVEKYMDKIRDLDDQSFSAARLKKELSDLVEEEGVGFGKLMLPLRVAVTGSGSGPDLFESLELIGREEIIKRLNFAIQNLGKTSH
ncbi:glutamate--tRNA ligase [Balneolales bacterium ANBcel1]|nr:glutamate--tRNA ligase [Balneolales bacterium ANBcel1]